ncbi:MAG: hypothetical protein ABIV48_04505 [Pyrinomonadaceae bacterium]
MKKSYELGQKQFNALLLLFSEVPEEAGKKYEQIRNGLIRFFEFRGCHDAQTLADETINRVATKIDSFDAARNIKLTAFFYGFASNVLSEYRRDSRREVPLEEGRYEDRGEYVSDDVDDVLSDCLSVCMAKLDLEDKDLITQYFSCDGRERIELRRRICEKLGCSPAALHTRIFRIKEKLKACIEQCAKSRM